MSITFETQKDFEDAVMAVLYERLNISVSVSLEISDDYYSRERVPKVEVTLVDTDDHQCIASAEGKA